MALNGEGATKVPSLEDHDMRDGAEDIESERTRLVYPFDKGPERGGAVEIAPQLSREDATNR